MVLNNLNVNLSIQASDVEVVLRVLQAFKEKKMLDFSVENPGRKELLALEGSPMTAAELRKIVEEAELEPAVSYAEFKSILEI